MGDRLSVGDVLGEREITYCYPASKPAKIAVGDVMIWRRNRATSAWYLFDTFGWTFKPKQFLGVSREDKEPGIECHVKIQTFGYCACMKIPPTRKAKTS